MDDKILLTISFISFSYFYYNIFMKNIEGMANVIGTTYTNNEDMKFNIPDKTFYYNISLKFLSNLPVIDQKTLESAIKIDTDNLTWNGKKSNLYEIINDIQTIYNNCNLNNNLNSIPIENNDLQNVSNKKDFIKLLPFMNQEILEKFNYDSIKCFIKQIQSDNLINIIEINYKFPEELNINNVLIINNYLYKILSEGILKYKLNIKKDKFGNLNNRNYLLNGSVESTLFDHLNGITKEDKDRIFILKGNIYKLDNKNLVNLSENKSNLISDESIDETNLIKLDEVFLDENIDDIEHIFDVYGKLYFIKENQIYPDTDLSKKINEFIETNKVNVNSVIPLYYMGETKVEFINLFHCEHDFYFLLKDDNELTDLQDFFADFGFKTKKEEYEDYTCDQYSSILSQLRKKNKINTNLRKNVLFNLKCKYN